MTFLKQDLKLRTLGFAMAIALGFAAATVNAKLAAPVLDDAAKAKAAEAAAKTAWTGKVEGYQLCKSMDKVATHVQKGGKTGTVTVTPPCADPGAFVYPPPVVATAAPLPAPAVAAPVAAKTGAAPAAAASAKKS